MAGTELPNRGPRPFWRRGDPLLHKHPKHLHEAWMGPDRPASNHLDAELLAKGLCLHVKIVENFEMIGKKPDGVDQHASGIAALQVPQVIQDVGAEPRIFRAAAAALVDEAHRSGAMPADSATRRHVSWICCA